MLLLNLALFGALLGISYSYESYYDYTGDLENAPYDPYADGYNYYGEDSEPDLHYSPQPHLNRMKHYKQSYEPKPYQETVPVVIKKKKQKKKKTLSIQHGFFISGGTAIFGKFKDLHSCMKACEITPTCFAGDFNPWVGKCYFHGNITACANMLSHKAITHFKKVPCDPLGTTRGIVVLGISVVGGIELKSTSDLQDCIKRCTSAGGGVASLDTLFQPENQVCCGVNYDFSTHKCYILPCPDTFALLNQLICDSDLPVTFAVGTPLNSLPSPTTVSISICPMASNG